MKNKWHSMSALNKHVPNQRINSIHCHACIETRLLLGVAKIKEFKTGRINQTP